MATNSSPRYTSAVRDADLTAKSATAEASLEPSRTDAAKQFYVSLCLYGVLISSGLWASLNLLHWFWRNLL